MHFDELRSKPKPRAVETSRTLLIHAQNRHDYAAYRLKNAISDDFSAFKAKRHVPSPSEGIAKARTMGGKSHLRYAKNPEDANVSKNAAKSNKSGRGNDIQT
jgi:hypothetical protein